MPGLREALGRCRACQSPLLAPVKRPFLPAAARRPLPARRLLHTPLQHPASADASRAAATHFRAGQPLPVTHPHLLGAGELTPGIPAAEYASRRKALMDGLEDGAVVLLASAPIRYMSGSIFYKYRQSSDFWYLTGWEEPDSVLLLEKNSSSKGHKMTLFHPGKSSNETWNGPRTDHNTATSVFGADEAMEAGFLTSRLKSILLSGNSAPLYTDIVPPTRTRSPKKKSLLEYLSPSIDKEAEEVAALLSTHTDRPVRAPTGEIAKLRVVKSAAEAKVMKRAAGASARAHGDVMRFIHSLPPEQRTEAAVVARFEYLTSLEGASRAAYVPVCASGPAALTIHYTSNSLPLKDGDLVLFDAGCELAGYASDVTRTWPVSGKFSGPQAELYDAVLRVEKECIKLCTAAEGRSMEDLHRVSVDLTSKELRKLGFGEGALRSVERVLYPHFLTHGVGVDLHDTPAWSRHDPIKAGMVITIEPGVFVPHDAAFPKQFHGLGVRVEDQVLVRANDYEVISVDAPKEVVDIEGACAGVFER